MSSKLPLIELLYSALNSDLGIVVETTDPIKLKQKLYTLRSEDVEFKRLSFVTSRTHPQTQLWIVKRPESHDEQNSPAETYPEP